MMKCPYCGSEILEGDTFCDHCGFTLNSATALIAPSATMTCPQCASPYLPGAVFCDNCGASLPAVSSTQDNAVICQVCGTENKGLLLCDGCGAKLATQELLFLPPLIVPRLEAERLIREHIERGKQIANQKLGPRLPNYQKALSETHRWLNLCYEILSRLFANSSVTEQFRDLFGRRALAYLNKKNPTSFRKAMNAMTVYLESILERVLLFPAIRNQNTLEKIEPVGKNVFVIHGHDEAPKESVARLISSLGLDPIILHELPNAGRTIIEKFEDYSNVQFAIALLTPDDMGASKEKLASKYRPRARQNVILELGYFMGKLGRGRVCALYKEGVEIPSDYQGVLYIPMDSGGAWQMKLAKEIKNAGIEIDLNKAL